VGQEGPQRRAHLLGQVEEVRPPEAPASRLRAAAARDVRQSPQPDAPGAGAVAPDAARLRQAGRGRPVSHSRLPAAR